MTWLEPGAAWWLLLVPALVALYLLRPRPQRMPISSLRLWRNLPQRQNTRTRLRRPPLSLLLLLQAALLAAGAFALLRPALTAPAGRHLVLLLDASGSMLAQDGATTRFEQARAALRDLIAGLGPEDRATLLRVGATVETVCAACLRADLGTALAGVRPGAARADLSAAFAVSRALAEQQGGGSLETVVVSDGAFAPLPSADLPPWVRYIPIGGSVDNRAITVLSARQPPDGSPGYTAYARVENLGKAAANTEITALADTVPRPVRRVTLPAGGHADLIWEIPPGTARFTVRLTPGDGLPADDQAVLLLAAAGQHPVHVQSAAPDLYLRALAGLPGLAPSTDAPAEAAAELTIIEGRLPDPLPGGSLLLVNPAGALLPATGQLANVRPTATGLDSPLLAGVDLQALQVRKAQQIAAVPWLDPVMVAEGGPLLLAGTRDGRRIAVLTFDPRDSNLPSLAAFPLLLANLVEWLDPLAGVQALHPGDPVPLAPAATVTAPDGTAARVGERGVYAGTEAAGLYQVTGGAAPARTFAVNMTDAGESALAPRPHPELQRDAPLAAPDSQTQQEFWPLLAALAAGLLGAEWILYCWKRGRL
jgi:hypothetical protein